MSVLFLLLIELTYLLLDLWGFILKKAVNLLVRFSDCGTRWDGRLNAGTKVTF